MMIDINASLSPAEKAKIEFSAHMNDLMREECDPSYRDLAKTSGVSKTTIGRILTEAHFPKWTTLRALLDALGVDETEIRATWKRRWIEAQDVIKPRPGRPLSQNNTEDTDKPVLHILNKPA
jgi:transcriptional regulator with XRE-family HTH domain